MKEAHKLVCERFPDRPGQVTVAYTVGGHILRGVRVDAVPDAACLCPETGPICEAARLRDPITALVTVAWNGPGAPIVVLTPCGICIERLLLHTHPEAEIATYDRFAEKGCVVKGYRDLMPRHPALPQREDHHQQGMRPIAAPLRRLADSAGIALLKQHFVDVFCEAMKGVPDGLIATRSQREPSPYARWNGLESATFRQIGPAFARATERLVEMFIEQARTELGELECNSDDCYNISLGRLTLVNVFSNLLQVVERGRPARYELPFEPYDPALLKHGRPMHEVIDAATTSERSDPQALLRHLAKLLRSRAPGGVIDYLRQRR
ncbi:MAG: hypothetical protein ACPG4T_08185, partial [Nannocystaceae bacterium]